MDDDFGLDGLDKELDQEVEDYDTLSFDDDDRKPTTGLGKTLDFAKGATSRSNIKNVGRHLLQNMPQSSALLNELKEINNISSDLKHDFTKDFQPVVSSLRGLTRFAIDSNKRYIPGRLYKRLDNFASGGQEASVESAKDTREAELTAKLDAVFGSGEEQKAILNETLKQNVTGEMRNAAISKQQLATMQSISGHLLFSNRFLATTHKNFMRKSLELKYRHVALAKDQLGEMKRLNASMASHLAAIVKNTGIPDTMKFKGTEQARKALYGSVYNKGIGKLSDIGANVASAIRDQLMSKFEDISAAMNMTVDGLESSKELNSIMGVSKQRSLGSTVGGIASGLVGRHISKRLGGVMGLADTYASGALRQFTGGARGAIMAASKSSNPLLRYVSNNFMGTPDNQIRMGNSMLKHGDRAAPFDVATRQTIVEVIPAWLARIAKNTKDIYEGYDTELEQYDVTSRRITTEAKARANIAKHIFGSVDKRSAGYTKSVGATMQAIDTSGLSIAADRKTLEKDIQQVIANAIAIRLPIRPQYLKPFMRLTSDDQIRDRNILALFKGVKNKLSTLQALFFTLTDTSGREDFAVSNSINSGIYDELSATGVHGKLASMIDKSGYGNLFRNQMSENGVIDQGWLTSEIGNVGNKRMFEEVRAGRAGYTSDMARHNRNLGDAESLKNSMVTLAKEPTSLFKSFEASRYSKFQKRGSANYNKLRKVFNSDGSFNVNNFIKSMATDEAASTQTLKDTYNLIQQMKIIELERQLLEERRRRRENPEDAVVENTRKTRFARRGNTIPDVDFFEGEQGMSRQFKGKFGHYGEEYRPFLMDALNKIAQRKSIQNIEGFLKARFSTLPSWRKTQLRVMESIHEHVVSMPVKLVTGLGKGLGKLLLKPFTNIWDSLKEKFNLVKNSKKVAAEKRAALERATKERDAIKRSLRTMVATENTALGVAALNVRLSELGMQNDQMIDLMVMAGADSVADMNFLGYTAGSTGTDGPSHIVNLDGSKYSGAVGVGGGKTKTGGTGKPLARASKAIRTKQAKRLSKLRKTMGKFYPKDKKDVFTGMRSVEMNTTERADLSKKAGLFGTISKITGGINAAVLGGLAAVATAQGISMYKKGAGGFFKDIAMRLGLTNRYDDAGDAKDTALDISKFRAQSAKIASANGFRGEFVNKHAALLAAGKADEASKLVESMRKATADLQQRMANAKSSKDTALIQALTQEAAAGGLSLTTNVGNKTHAAGDYSLATKFKSWRQTKGDVYKKQLTSSQRANIDQLRAEGRHSEVAAQINSFAMSNMENRFGAQLYPMPGTANRENDLLDRFNLLSRRYHIPDHFMQEYRRYVNSNQAQEAALLLRDARGYSETDPKVAKLAKANVLTKAYKMLFTDGSLEWAKFGAGPEDTPLLKELYKGGYYNEVNWYLDDLHWSAYQKSGYADAYSSKGSMWAQSKRKTLAMAHFVKNPSKWASLFKKNVTHIDFATGTVTKTRAATRLSKLLDNKVTRGWEKGIRRFGHGAANLARKSFGENTWIRGTDWIRKLGRGAIKLGDGLNRIKTAAAGFLKTKVGPALKGFVTWLSKYVPKFVSQGVRKFGGWALYFLFLAAGIIRGLTMSADSSAKFDNRFTGGAWSRAFQTLMVAIDPYDTGISIVRCIKAAVGAARAHSGAKESEARLNSMAETLMAKRDDPGISDEKREAYQQIINKLVGAVAENGDDVGEDLSRGLNKNGQRADAAEANKRKSLLSQLSKMPGLSNEQQIEMRRLVMEGDYDAVNKQLHDHAGNDPLRKSIAEGFLNADKNAVQKTVYKAKQAVTDTLSTAGANIDAKVTAVKTTVANKINSIKDMFAKYGLAYQEHVAIIMEMVRRAPYHVAEYICALVKEQQGKLVAVADMVGGKFRGFDPFKQGAPKSVAWFQRTYTRAAEAIVDQVGTMGQPQPAANPNNPIPAAPSGGAQPALASIGITEETGQAILAAQLEANQLKRASMKSGAAGQQALAEAIASGKENVPLDDKIPDISRQKTKAYA